MVSRRWLFSEQQHSTITFLTVFAIQYPTFPFLEYLPDRANSQNRRQKIQPRSLPSRMSTYEPPSFPQRPKVPTLLGEAKYQAQLLHFRYEINTGLYVMLPGEKLAFNLIHLFVATLLLSAVYYCMPLSLINGVRQAVSCLCNGYISRVRPWDIHEAILRSHATDEAFASLAYGAEATNATITFPGIL